MTIASTAHLMLYSDSEPPEVRIEGIGAYIVWTTEDGRITVSSGDAEALRRVSEAFASAARLVDTDPTDPDVARTLAIATGGAA